jgi:hypothetical protein
MAGALVVILLVVYRYISTGSSDRGSGPTPTAKTPGVAPASLPKILVEEILKEARAIDTEFYDVLMKNLPAIKGEAGIKFKERVLRFYETNQPHIVDLSVDKAFKAVSAIKKNFDDLQELKGAIFFNTGGSVGKIDKSGTIQLPKDGNCLFHALGQGLTLLEDTLRSERLWRDFPVDHANIRARVIEWMRAHIKEDVQLAKEIDNAVIEWCPLLDQQQAKERMTIEAEKARSDCRELEKTYQERTKLINLLKKVTVDKPGTPEIRELYIKMTEGEGDFASGPHMYAFCKLNPEIGIRICRKICFVSTDGSDRREFISNDFNLPFNEGARFFINPVFNLAGDHFDLRVETIPKS